LKVGVCLCRYSVACYVVSYWIDTLVLKTEGNTYAPLLHHPFLFKGKTNASSRGSKKDIWHRCRGDLCPAKTYQVPIINSHPSHYIICHSPLVFLSPTSKTIFEKILPFFAPLSFVFFVYFLCARVLDCLLCRNVFSKKMLTLTLGG
jgi:hypothetical protein